MICKHCGESIGILKGEKKERKRKNSPTIIGFILRTV